MDRCGLDEGSRFRLQPCVSAIWDEALASIGLADSGLPANSRSLRQAGEWLLSKQVTKYGDWSIKNRKGKPGGWAFEFFNDNYPDVDDTAAVVSALQRIETQNPEAKREAL